MDAVERQVEAYNAHDADAFAACYAEGVVIYRLGESGLIERVRFLP